MADLKQLLTYAAYAFICVLLVLGAWSLSAKFDQLHKARKDHWIQAKRRWDQSCEGRDYEGLGLLKYCTDEKKIKDSRPLDLAVMDLLYFLVLCDMINCVDFSTKIAANITSVYWGVLVVLFLLAFITYFGCVRPNAVPYHHAYSLPTDRGSLKAEALPPLDPYHVKYH